VFQRLRSIYRHALSENLVEGDPTYPLKPGSNHPDRISPLKYLTPEGTRALERKAAAPREAIERKQSDQESVRKQRTLRHCQL